MNNCYNQGNLQVYNISKKTILCRDLKVADSFTDKTFGLLKKSNSRSLLFKTRFGVHTFFLKEPIDIIILGNKYQVIKAKTVRPNSLFFYNPIYFRVLELSKGIVKKSHTKIGDQIAIKE